MLGFLRGPLLPRELSLSWASAVLGVFRGGCLSQVKPESRHHRMSRECMLLGSVSSQPRFGVTDIKAPSAVHSSRVLDRDVALRSRADRLIALRQISVTGLNFI